MLCVFMVFQNVGTKASYGSVAEKSCHLLLDSMLNHAWAEEEEVGWEEAQGREGDARDVEQAL